MSDRNIKDWVDGYLRHTFFLESPTIFKKWSAASAIASALQRKCFGNIWGEDIFPNMYIVLIGPSGVRKTTAVRPAEKLLRKLGIDLSADSLTRERLIDALMESGKFGSMKKATIGVDFHSSLTIFAEELTVFLGYKNLQMISDLCSWYDCKNVWNRETRNSGEAAITNVWVNLLGATTPDSLKSSLPRDAIGGGLTSRMIFIYSEKKGKIVLRHRTTDDERDYGELLKADLSAIQMMSGEFQFTEDFWTIWEDWAMKGEKNPPFTDNILGKYTERRRGHAMKLSMILSASRSSKMKVDEQDILRAISWLEEAEKDMPRVFYGMGENELAAVIDQVLRYVITKDFVSVKQVQLQFMNDVDDWTLKMKVLATLFGAGVIKFVTKDKKRFDKREHRPEDLYILYCGDEKRNPTL